MAKTAERVYFNLLVFRKKVCLKGAEMGWVKLYCHKNQTEPQSCNSQMSCKTETQYQFTSEAEGQACYQKAKDKGCA